MKHLDEGTLQAWLDMPRSGLDASEVAEIEGHLAVCESCAAELEALRGSDRSVHSLLAAGLDRDIERPPFEEVVARAEGRAPGGGMGARRGLSRLNRLAWAASIVVAVGVGWLTNEIYRAGPPAPTSRVPVSPASAPDAEVAAEAPLQAPSEPDLAQEPGTSVAGADEQAPSAFGLNAPTSADEVREQVEPRAGRLEEAERSAQPAAPPPAAGPAADAVASSSDGRDGAGVGAAAPEPDAQPTRRYERQRSVADDTARNDVADVARPVVRGVVRDAATGGPVQSAQVFVERFNIGALTGRDGSYTLILPAADSLDVDVTVQRIGYGTETRQLEVARGAPAVADFTLEEEALLLQEVVVTGTAGQAQRRALGNTVERVDAAPFAWRSTTPEGAEAALGRSPLTVPDLPVTSLESADAPDAEGGLVVRVRQRLADGGTLVLVEGPSDESRDGWPISSDGALGSARVGGLLVTATAPVGADALQELLRRIR